MSSILTPRATAKMNLLKTHCDDLQATANAAVKRTGEIRHATAFKTPAASPYPDLRQPASRPSAEASALIAELEREQAHAQVQQAKAANARQLISQIEFWQTSLPNGATLADAKLPVFDAKMYSSVHDELAAIREKIGKLAVELKRTNQSVPTRAEREAAAKRWVTALVAKGEPTIHATHAKFDVKFTQVDGTMMSKTDTALAIAAWAVGPEAFLKRILQSIKDQPDDKLALTAEGKVRQVKAIRDDLLQAEREEEAIIEYASTLDMFIARRPLASPLAVLGLELVTAAPKGEPVHRVSAESLRALAAR